MSRIEEIIPLDSIKFEGGTQYMKIRDEMVDKIAENYNENLLDSILCVYELFDGKTKGYFTIKGIKYSAICYDGRHRVMALKKIGKENIAASLFDSVDNIQTVIQAINNRSEYVKKFLPTEATTLSCGMKCGPHWELSNILEKYGYKKTKLTMLTDFLQKKHHNDYCLWDDLIFKYIVCTGREKRFNVLDFKKWYKISFK